MLYAYYERGKGGKFSSISIKDAMGRIVEWRSVAGKAGAKKAARAIGAICMF